VRHSAATGSILAPKIKLAPQGYTVASATPNEPYTNDSTKNDVPEMQQTVAVLPMPPQQEAASAIVSMVPTQPADSFESRWSGLHKTEIGLAFDARWALDSQ
jgi:hypothetical protein